MKQITKSIPDELRAYDAPLLLAARDLAHLIARRRDVKDTELDLITLALLLGSTAQEQIAQKKKKK